MPVERLVTDQGSARLKPGLGSSNAKIQRLDQFKAIAGIAVTEGLRISLGYDNGAFQRARAFCDPLQKPCWAYFVGDKTSVFQFLPRKSITEIRY